MGFFYFGYVLRNEIEAMDIIWPIFAKLIMFLWRYMASGEKNVGDIADACNTVARDLA